jgi:NADPH-dependent 2,4-dienoyl-CoA reductase/sulfur reductase-like enzyme
MSVTRRSFVLASGAAALLAHPFAAKAQAGEHVVIVGGGFGGATAAKYLRRFNPALRITLVEPADQFVMCPMSNRVIHGGLNLADISRGYERFLDRYALRRIKASADDIDAERSELRVGSERIGYDRLIVAPGVDFDYSEIPGLESASAQALVPHAWKAGPQTQRLKEMLQAMPEGGTVAIHIPKVPYRCPPGPYERASLIAYYLKLYKPRAKLLVFDANPEIQSKKGLFEAAWKSKYAQVIEYLPNADIDSVDAASRSIELKVHGRHKVDVLNVIPPQRAGAIARKAGLASVGGRWCGVDFLSYASTRQRNIHVIGDAIAGAPGMPKSGHMANQEAKVCAGAIAALSLGQPVPAEPIIANTCYSFVSQNEAMHVASVHRFDPEKRTMVSVKGAGGLSPAASATEGLYAMAWAVNILNDTLG